MTSQWDMNKNTLYPSQPARYGVSSQVVVLLLRQPSQFQNGLMIRQRRAMLVSLGMRVLRTNTLEHSSPISW